MTDALSTLYKCNIRMIFLDYCTSFAEFVKIWMGETSTDLEKKVGGQKSEESDNTENKDNKQLNQLTVPN